MRVQFQLLQYHLSTEAMRQSKSYIERFNFQLKPE